MPKIAYLDTPPLARSTLLLIADADRIAREYAAMGYDMTVRQIYYQFVAHDLFPEKRTWTWNGSKWVKDPNGTKNAEPNYKYLCSAINKGRMHGYIDWNHITDRTRELESNPHWENPGEIIQGSAQAYALDKWEGQDNRVEVWIEKDALVGVIEPTCERRDVDYFSCRGYTSQSEMWGAAMRMKSRERNDGQRTVIIHLGDHDPSGIDMSRDIRDRLATFGASIEFVRVALNMDQIEELNPPPNPTKLTDSRAGKYIEEFGSECWELDAVPPDQMAKLIDDEITNHCDEDLWDEVETRQEQEREILEKASDNWDEVSTFIDNEL